MISRWWNVALVLCWAPDAAPHRSQPHPPTPPKTPHSARGFTFKFSTLAILSQGLEWTPFPFSFTAVNKWLQEGEYVWLGLDMLFLCSCSCKEFFVEVGMDEPGVRVVLHEAVDLLLSCQEACCCGVIKTLNDVISRLIIQVYLKTGASSEWSSGVFISARLTFISRTQKHLKWNWQIIDLFTSLGASGLMNSLYIFLAFVTFSLRVFSNLKSSQAIQNSIFSSQNSDLRYRRKAVFPSAEEVDKEGDRCERWTLAAFPLLGSKVGAWENYFTAANKPLLFSF